MWLNWQRDQMNNPSLTDYYIMRLTQLVYNMMSASDSPTKELNQFKLKFVSVPSTPASKNQSGYSPKTSKAIWLGALGISLADKT